MKFRKKPIVIDAVRWLEVGDHDSVVSASACGGAAYSNRCRRCSNLNTAHGWLLTLEGSLIVCPGDWIITGIKGEHYLCKPDIFNETYEAVE